MSVVAGCGLFDGVLLGADCRVTIQRPGHAPVYCDTVQKVFAVVPGLAIGFVGEVRAASVLLQELFRRTPRRRRHDPVSLSQWIPRLFRRTYAASRARLSTPDVSFMVAFSIAGRANVVERKAVGEMLTRIASGETTIRRNFVPNIFLRILSTPPEVQFIALEGMSYSALYVMHAPDFDPVMYKPLEFAAIGSGGGARTLIAQYHDWILAGVPGNPTAEIPSFRDAMRHFAQQNGIEGVGGMCPVLRLAGRDLRAFGESYEIPAGGERIELVMEGERWIQQNLTTGRRVALDLPWAASVGASQPVR
jgi:hypothetical protein